MRLFFALIALLIPTTIMAEETKRFKDWEVTMGEIPGGFLAIALTSSGSSEILGALCDVTKSTASDCRPFFSSDYECEMGEFLKGSYTVDQYTVDVPMSCFPALGRSFYILPYVQLKMLRMYDRYDIKVNTPNGVKAGTFSLMGANQAINTASQYIIRKAESMSSR